MKVDSEQLNRLRLAQEARNNETEDEKSVRLSLAQIQRYATAKDRQLLYNDTFTKLYKIQEIFKDTIFYGEDRTKMEEMIVDLRSVVMKELIVIRRTLRHNEEKLDDE